MFISSPTVKRVASISLLVLLLLPGMLAAAEPSKPKAVGVEELMGIMARIARWIFTALIVVAVITGVIAGYQYATAGGDAEKLATARTNTLYALIALAIGVLAFSIPRIVCSVLGPAVINPADCNPFRFDTGGPSWTIVRSVIDAG